MGNAVLLKMKEGFQNGADAGLVVTGRGQWFEAERMNPSVRTGFNAQAGVHAVHVRRERHGVAGAGGGHADNDIA